jgi:histidine triad (HIT) family protein
MPYDPKNIFAKILRGELSCQKVHETPHALAFHDIRPQAPIHVLVIPKGEYTSYIDFCRMASNEEMDAFWRAVAGGYRLIVNSGVNAHQEVPHFHVHILGGRTLGAMVAPQ